MIMQTIMGDQNCLLAILAHMWPDLAVDTSMRVLCVDYLLVKQKQQPQSPRVFSSGFLWVTKILAISAITASLGSLLLTLISLSRCER